MRNLATAAAVLAAAVVVVANGSAKPEPSRPAMDVVGQVYVNDNTAGGEHGRRLRPARRRLADRRCPARRSTSVVRAAGTATPRRDHCSSATTGATCSPSTRAATRSRCSGSSRTARSRRRRARRSTRAAPTRSASPSAANLVYVANQGPGVTPGDANYTGFTLNPGGHLRPIPGSTYALPSDAVPGEVLFNADGSRLVGTRIGTSAIDSFTVGTRRASDRGAGLAVRRPGVHAAAGVRPARERVQPDQPRPAVRVGRPHRGRRPRPRPRLELHRRRERHPHADRRLARRQRRHGVVLGRDQPGRHVSVRREHRVDDGLELLDRGRRVDLRSSSSTPSTDLGAGAEDARLSPDGSSLWVVQAGADAVTGFSVSGGTLTPLSTTAGPAGATPTGIVVT